VRGLWTFLGDTRLTFWSLCVVAALFLVGGVFAVDNFELINGLNETRIQDWIAANLAANLSVAWWLPALLAALLALGLNIAACTVQRFSALWPTRRGRPLVDLLRDLTPTAVHALFAVVMVGHLVTITCGEWRRIPLTEGAAIGFPGDADLVVSSRRDVLFPAAKGQPRRVAETRVKLVSGDGAVLEVSHGSPLSYGGAHIVLDRRKAKSAKTAKKAADEDCNGEKDSRIDTKIPKTGDTLLVVDDPGVRIIVPAFVLILLLMGAHFATRHLGPIRKVRGLR
jgi:hypothetical protein